MGQYLNGIFILPLDCIRKCQNGTQSWGTVHVYYFIQIMQELDPKFGGLVHNLIYIMPEYARTGAEIEGYCIIVCQNKSKFAPKRSGVLSCFI